MAHKPRKSIFISRGNNSNSIAVQRAEAARRTAHGIASLRRNAHEAALQRVHNQIDDLASIPPRRDEYVVERLVPSRFQVVAQTRIPGFLRRRGILVPEHEPTTVAEYAHGPSEEVLNPQRLVVAEQLRGWLLPHVIKKLDAYTRRHIATPSQDVPGALIVVSDHRSWGGGTRPYYDGPADMPPPNVIGVLDNRSVHYGDHAIEGFTEVHPHSSHEFVRGQIDKLDAISDALATVRRSPPAP